MQSLLDQFKDQPLLVTTDNWFFAPDGKSYRAVWGKVCVYKDEETLGIKTNAQSANWYALIGEGEKRVIVAGCQIRYACVCTHRPVTDNIRETRVSDQAATEFIIDRETAIYIAE